MSWIPPNTPISVSRELRSVSIHQCPCVLIQRLLAGVGGDRGGAGSEDCLKVNIYTPSKATAGSDCESEFFIL